MSKITHVVMDWGGVIHDTSKLWDYLVDFGLKRGVNFSNKVYDLIFETNSNKEGGTELVDTIMSELNVTDNNERVELTVEIVRDGTNSMTDLVPGVNRLVQHLYRNHIPMAIATNANKKQFQMNSSMLGDFATKYFSHVVCGAEDPDVIHNKPDPQVYEVCAQRFKPQPKSLDSVLIIEDSIRGITGAMNTGMKTLLINDGRRADLSSLVGRVTCIAHCFDNFKPESVGLPSYD